MGARLPAFVRYQGRPEVRTRFRGIAVLLALGWAGSFLADGILSASAAGLRNGRRISHAFVMAAPIYRKPLIVTDATVNIAPSLDEKRDICQNAIDLAHALGNPQPKVAILSAVEEVTTRIPSTCDAAALCKMADRGQITGAILDGPLALDNAISPEAAEIKGIVSPVAGDGDILLVPNIEAGNILAKDLIFRRRPMRRVSCWGPRFRLCSPAALIRCALAWHRVPSRCCSRTGIGGRATEI